MTPSQEMGLKVGDRVVFVDPPEYMVGDFGVVTEVDRSDTYPYKATYNDGRGIDYYWRNASEIKPYEAE